MIRTAFVGAVVARIAALIVKEQSTENGPAEKGGRAGMSRSAKHSVSFSISFLQRFNLALSLLERIAVVRTHPSWPTWTGWYSDARGTHSRVVCASLST